MIKKTIGVFCGVVILSSSCFGADVILSLTIPEDKIQTVLEAFQIDKNIPPAQQKVEMQAQLKGFVVGRVLENEVRKKQEAKTAEMIIEYKSSADSANAVVK